MSSMTAKQMQKRPLELRHSVQDGEVVALTFRGTPYAYVVPADQWHKVSPSKQSCDREQGDAA